MIALSYRILYSRDAGVDLSGEIYGTVDNNVEDQVEKIDGLMRKVLEKNEADEPKIWYSEPYEIIKCKCP